VEIDGGTIQASGGRGVFVPSGSDITADMIMAGARLIIEKDLEIGPYSARHLALEIFKAMIEASRQGLI
jgi:hypothetical protein